MPIRPEAAEDRDAVFEIVKTAFGREAEALLVNRLRDAGQLAVSLVAAVDGGVVGHVAFSPMTLSVNPKGRRAIGLAPLAVLPELQRQGIGGRLVEAGLEQSAAQGWDLAFVLGDPGYYPHFGFMQASGHGLRWEGEAPLEAFMVKELRPGGLRNVSGTAGYHPAFDSV